MPEIADEQVKGCEAANDGNKTVEECEREIALFGDLPAKDEIGKADGGDRDKDRESEDKNCKAGADAEGDHVLGSLDPNAGRAGRFGRVALLLVMAGPDGEPG